MKYTRDISKERNNKEVILYDKKKKRKGEGSAENPLYPTKEDKNYSKKQFISF